MLPARLADQPYSHPLMWTRGLSWILLGLPVSSACISFAYLCCEALFMFSCCISILANVMSANVMSASSQCCAHPHDRMDRFDPFDDKRKCECTTYMMIIKFATPEWYHIHYSRVAFGRPVLEYLYLSI